MYLFWEYIVTCYESFSFSSHVIEPLYWQLHNNVFSILYCHKKSETDLSLFSIETLNSIFFDYAAVQNISYDIIYYINVLVFKIFSYSLLEFEYFFSSVFNTDFLMYSFFQYFSETRSVFEQVTDFNDEVVHPMPHWNYYDYYYLSDYILAAYYNESDIWFVYEFEFNFLYWFFELINTEFYYIYNISGVNFDQIDFFFLTDSNDTNYLMLFYPGLELLISHVIDYDALRDALNVAEYDMYIKPYTNQIEWFSDNKGLYDGFFVIYYHEHNLWMSIDLCNYLNFPCAEPFLDTDVIYRYKFDFFNRMFLTNVLPVLVMASDYWRILGFKTFIIEYLNKFVHPVFFEIYCQIYKHNFDVLFYNQSTISYTFTTTYMDSVFLNLFCILFIFFYFINIFILLINLKTFRKKSFFIHINNRLNKILEYDFGPNSEIKFFFLVLFFYFFVFFFKTYTNVMGLSSWSEFVFYYILFLIFICTFYPLLFVYKFGLYFLNYIKGADKKKSLFKDFFFDHMSLISYFSRFFLQLIRVILIFIVYFAFHEFYFDAFINSIICDCFIYIVCGNYLFYYLFIFIRLFYELLDFLMILALQLIAFFAVMFVLFSFLFSSNINSNYENYINKLCVKYAQ